MMEMSVEEGSAGFVVTNGELNGTLLVGAGMAVTPERELVTLVEVTEVLLLPLLLTALVLEVATDEGVVVIAPDEGVGVSRLALGVSAGRPECCCSSLWW